MRVPTALVVQREFRKAWGDELAANLDLNKLGFPIVNHRDGTYWLLDGQHRIYALKQNGFDTDVLDCEVYEGLTDEEMASIFLGRDSRRKISPFDHFHIACTAGFHRENAIRRAVETQGLRISRNKGENTVSAVSALAAVFDSFGDPKDGEIILGRVLRILKTSFLGDPEAFTSVMIQGLGMVFLRYPGRIDERNMTTQLSAIHHGVNGLLRRAETQHLRTGNLKTQCVAAVMVETYNKGLHNRSKDYLPSWWKQAAE